MHSDDHMIIIMRIETKGILLVEDDIILCFSLGISGEAKGYYICHEQLLAYFV